MALLLMRCSPGGLPSPPPSDGFSAAAVAVVGTGMPPRLLLPGGRPFSGYGCCGTEGAGSRWTTTASRGGTESPRDGPAAASVAAGDTGRPPWHRLPGGRPLSVYGCRW